jgi:hypothetical protein
VKYTQKPILGPPGWGIGMRLTSSWKNGNVEKPRPNLKGCSVEEEEEDYQIKGG